MYCGIERSQRVARSSDGAPRTSPSASRSRTARSTSRPSGRRGVSGSRAPPRKTVSSACPSGARPGKRLELQTPPRMRREASGTTRWPKPASGRRRAASGHARCRTASGGCSIESSAAAASGANGRTRLAASAAGAARMTSSASISARASRTANRPAAGPIRSTDGSRAERAPEGPGHRPRQRREPLAEREETADARARLRVVPPRLARAPRMAPRRMLPASRSQRVSAGKASGADRRLASPAKIPETKGATTRSATSGPNRRVKKSRTLSSGGAGRLRRGSARIPSFPETERADAS